jgi:hypothetical protein
MLRVVRFIGVSALCTVAMLAGIYVGYAMHVI